MDTKHTHIYIYIYIVLRLANLANLQKANLQGKKCLISFSYTFLVHLFIRDVQSTIEGVFGNTTR
jgi:hypothetical protein